VNEDYETISVESTDTPPNLDGANWYRYTIGQGTNRIFGLRQGDLPTITKSLEDLVLRLNDSRIGKTGRVQLYTTKRGKTPDPGKHAR